MANPRLFSRTGYRVLLASSYAAVVLAWLAVMDHFGYIRLGRAPAPQTEEPFAAAQSQETQQKRENMRLVCMSDTHRRHKEINIPPGDVLIFAGDFMNGGSFESEVKVLNDWLGTLPHPHKIVIGGNMDYAFEKVGKDKVAEIMQNATYLEDSQVSIGGHIFYGSPYTPQFVGAFQLYTDEDAVEMVAKIPDKVDVLITHGPPKGILDSTSQGAHVGCPRLLERVREIKPKIHVFGHVHAGFGVATSEDGATRFGNTAQYPKFEGHSNCEPLVFDLEA